MFTDLISNTVMFFLSFLILFILLAGASLGLFNAGEDINANIHVSENSLQTHSLALAFMENYNETDEGVGLSRFELLSLHYSLKQGSGYFYRPIYNTYTTAEGKEVNGENLEEFLKEWNKDFARKNVRWDQEGYSFLYTDEPESIVNPRQGNLRIEKPITSGIYIEDLEHDFDERRTGIPMPVPYLNTSAGNRFSFFNSEPEEPREPEKVKEVWINARGD